jgi:hypothetical protein
VWLPVERLQTTGSHTIPATATTSQASFLAVPKFLPKGFEQFHGIFVKQGISGIHSRGINRT